MIKFHDPSGTPHFGQATITRTTSVNGGLSLTGEVFAGDDVLNGLDYGWWLNFDNEKYVITYKKLSDDTNTVVFDAVQQFFWDFAKVALHAQYTGSHEYTFYLGQLFDKSGYTYKNDVTVPAFEKENWGYKNKLDLFNDIIDQAGVEFEVHNETVHIAKQIGSDLTSFARKGINLSDLTEEMKISDFATYAKGYGAFKDAEDQSKGRLEVEYRSELAKQFGDLEMDPIVDERYTIADNLIAALKKQVDATYTVSMTMNIYDLENAGYPNYEAPKVGDWILAIDEALNFKRKIRIIQLEEQFDVTGKRIGYTATCGDLSIVDQYTHLQSSLDSKVQRIQESIDSVATSANGKNKNYYGAKEPVNADEGDLWFDQSNSDPDKWSIKQWVNGRWEQLTLNPGEVDSKVSVAKAVAETAIENAQSASDKADQLASKYDDTNSLANQALGRAASAQSDASSAISKAESTASEFGKVDQKAGSALTAALSAQENASSAVATANSTASGFGRVEGKADSAVASALDAQSAASDAVKQASSAAVDSKDAKQIAGAVSQSYKTLTDGSTMTIAELQSGLAVKLTKSDLNGYATQTWAQNQIKMTADGINGTMSSIKSTVDGQTTSINDLKADSSSFKSQFTRVNNTLGKQTTDISTLQASSQELTTGFNTLTSDNATNKNDISQLKQTATEVSSTLETVKTQVQDSSVGTNLYTDTRDFDNPDIWSYYSVWHKATEKFNGLTVMVANTDWFGLGQDVQVKKGEIYTFSLYSRYESGTGKSDMYLLPNGSTAVLSLAYAQVSLNETWQRISVTFTVVGDGTIHPRIERGDHNTNTLLVAGLKLERGSVMTDYSTSPLDTATVTAFSKLSQTVDGIKTDISKKIEQKDLNGYATQTWAQNQIKMTADGINGTMSSIKSTVDSQTTSINTLQTDSNGFKTQFDTVNNTLGKQTTDISSLQASSKELTTGFNTLTIDNTTNKNDISQLKQTATEVSSTLETVQTQVQDSSVGTNLYTDTRDFDNPDIWSYYSVWHKATEKFNGLTVMVANTDWFGLGQDVQVKKGEIYTFSLYSRYESGTGKSDMYLLPNGSTAVLSLAYAQVSLNETWQRISVTFTVVGDGTIHPRIERGDHNTNTLLVAGLKLERGSVMTDYSTSPLDTATVTAFSKLSQTVDGIKTDISKKIEQKDLNGYATQAWTQNQIKITADGINATLSSVKTTVDGHATSINDLKADSSGFKAQFTTVNNTLGKQTTDIGSLQATSKELSSNFSSLSTDNNTNKNDISQLKQSSKEFNSTLMSVQQKVADGLISTNIFRSANDFSRSYWTDAFGYPFTTLQSESRYHDSLIHYQGQGKTPAPYSTIAQQTITDDAMAADAWYTLSFYARGAGDNNTVGKFAVYFYGNGSDQSMSNSDGVEVLGTSDTHCIITLTPYFRRYVITFHTPKDFSGGHSFWARNDLDLNDGSLYCDFWHPKLELGKVASDFSVNPADTATVSALSSISQTVDAIQTTVRGKVDNEIYQSKMTQINNAIIAKVSKGDVTNENILPYSGYWSDTTGWTLMSWGAADRNLNLIHHNFYHNAVDATLCVGTSMADTASAGSTKFNVIPNTTYTMTFWGFASGNVKGTNVYVLGRTFASTKDYDYVHVVQANLIMSPSGINKYTATFTTNSDETQAYVRLDNQGSTNGQSSGAYFAELKIERGDTATPYTRVSSGEIQVTSDNINLKVSKDGVINAINISKEGTSISGNKLHITADTYIDNAVIKDAMIANLSADKLTAGSINAGNINVYNINGANIVANSISADKLQAGAMLIAMNSTLQTLKIGTDGLYTTDSSGKAIGKIHTNRSVQHPENWGLDFDLNSDGKFMSWGAQNEGDPNGDYGIKFGWTRNSSASDFGMPWGGFWFNDNVMLHKNLRFDGGGIDVDGAYQLMKFAWISMNGTKYPFFGSSNLKAGWLFGSNETYLVRGDGVINASKILGVLNGQSYKFVKSLNPDGSVKVYTDVHF